MSSFYGVSSVSVACAATPKLTAEEYESAKKLTLEILKRFPPEDFYYVSWGRSFSILAEIMRVAGIQTLKEVPFSNAKNITDELYSDKTFTTRLRAHLDRFLPSPLERGHRRLLIMDYASSGKGAERVVEALEWYYASVGRELDFQLLLATDYSNHARFRDLIPGINWPLDTPIPPRLNIDLEGQVNLGSHSHIRIDSVNLDTAEYGEISKCFSSQKFEGISKFEPFPFGAQDYMNWRPKSANLVNANYKMDKLVLKKVERDPKRIKLSSHPPTGRECKKLLAPPY